MNRDPLADEDDLGELEAEYASARRSLFWSRFTKMAKYYLGYNLASFLLWRRFRTHREATAFQIKFYGVMILICIIIVILNSLR